MIENIVDNTSNHMGIFDYVFSGLMAVLLPALCYASYRAIKEQRKELQGMLMNKDVDYLTRLKAKGIITIDEDKLKPYDRERLAATTWSKEKGIVRTYKYL